mgnify:FL=1
MFVSLVLYSIFALGFRTGKRAQFKQSPIFRVRQNSGLIKSGPILKGPTNVSPKKKTRDRFEKSDLNDLGCRINQTLLNNMGKSEA